MAFTAANLSLVGGSNGFSHWHYRSATDAMATIVAAGYFTGDAPRQMGPKDIMSVEGKGSTGLFSVMSNKSGCSLSRIADEWVHEADKIYLYSITPQVQLLAGTSTFVVSPVAGWVTRLSTIVETTVTTTGGTLTVEIATAAVKGLSNVIPDSSVAVAGTVYTGEPRYARDDTAYVTARQAIELVGDANFAGAGVVVQIVEITPEVADASNTVYVGEFINQIDLLAATSRFIVSPVAGQISRLTTVTVDDVTTGGAVTVELATVAVTGLSVTVGNAGGVGDVDTDAPTTVSNSTGTVAVGTPIELVFGSAFATAGSIYCVLEIEPTAATDTVWSTSYIEATALNAGTSYWAYAPITGYITGLYTTSSTDITTGGVVTLELGGVLVPGISLTVGNAGGVGDADSDVPSGSRISADAIDGGNVPRNAVTKGDAVEIIPSAAFGATGTLSVLIEYTPIK